MKLFQLISKLKVGKFLIHGSLLIYEDPITGVLRKVNLKTKETTLFDAHCSKEMNLPLTVWGLCLGSNNTLLHSWGGNLRTYSLDSLFKKQKQVTRYSKAYLSKARAILIPDYPDKNNNMETEEKDDLKLFCEHMGFFYCIDNSTLTRVSQSGKCESIHLTVNIVCMYSCPEKKQLFVCDDQGRLLTLDISPSLSPQFCAVTSVSFVRPRQILQHQSLFYVLDSRGLWILEPTLKFFEVPHVLHFAVESSDGTADNNIVCKDFNRIFCIS